MAKIMEINKVKIKNFKRLQDIEFEIKNKVSVIVGPNAVGKSTIFEAIRLAKAILFPRMGDELRNVLISLGATSAHFYQSTLQYDITALARNPNLPTSIKLEVTFTQDEISKLKTSKAEIAKNLATTLLGKSLDDQMLDMRVYFSTPQGAEAMRQSIIEVDNKLETLSPANPIELSVELTSNHIQTSDTVTNLCASFLERVLPADKALMIYFPADRSMPAGEISIQVGAQDFKAQADSHLSLAINKYGRLKQTVVNQTFLGELQGVSFKETFNEIFNALLPGKEFIGLQQKQTGLVSVVIKDIESNSEFDIDSLSSGEKGLILSFLLFSTSSSQGSIILVDEPELHLNPAVCKKILPYLIESISKKSDCQFIITTHNAEILKDAFEREDIDLFHLRNDKDISPVFLKDGSEYVEALNRLGVNPEKALTSRGTLFVEGDTDVTLLQNAFSDILGGVLVQALNGRNEVHKSITQFQTHERNGELKETIAFLFDHDGKPTELSSSSLVRIEQLQKYCLENYLIDEECLYDAIRKYAVNPPESRGQFSKDLKELAMSQLDEAVTNKILNEYRVLRAGLKTKDIKDKSISDIAKMQLDQLKEVHNKISSIISSSDWENNLLELHTSKKNDLIPIWENDWKNKCSGKTLFTSIQKKYQINHDPLRLKVELISRLSELGRDDITALHGILNRLLRN
jgi:predicted ATPase